MIEPKSKDGGSHEGPPRSNDKELDETVASVETTPSKPDDSENLRLAEEIKAETAKIKKLKKENDKLEQVKKKKGKGKKGSTVKQSPVKESEDEVEVEYETRCDCPEEPKCKCERFECVYCPCADFSVAKESLQCTACYIWFHIGCGNLKGLTGNEAMMLEGWTCCTCFVTVSPLAQMLFQVNKPEVVKKVADVLEVNGSKEKDVTLRDLSTEIQELKGLVRISQMSSRPAGVVGKGVGSSEMNCTTVKVMLKEELHLIVPVICARVQDVVEEGVKKNVEANVEQKKSWANIAQGYKEEIAKVAVINKDMVKSVVTESNKNQAEITESNINHEQWQRIRRKMNIIIRKVPECNSEDIDARIKHDRTWLVENTDIKKDDIVRCMRPGQKRDGNPRPLICQLKNEDLVQRYTEHGKGSKIGDGLPKDSLFINVDLSPADQESDFQARKVRKESRRGQA